MRSKAAAQLLLADGFSHIFNMSGGIISYDGGKAVGDEKFGMEFFVSGDFSDVFRMSYAMEEGLQQLYLILEELCEDNELKTLLARLAQFEEGHKAKLKALFPMSTPENLPDANILEGGFNRQQIIDHFQSRIVSREDVIQMGMMLETQAFDLYSRLAAKEKNAESKAFFEFMVDEEKQHLALLSNEYDNFLS